MQKLELIKNSIYTYRILSFDEDNVLVVDCNRCRVPFWIKKSDAEKFKTITETEFLNERKITIPSFEELSLSERQDVRNKYASISPLLAVLSSDNDRNDTIAYIAKNRSLNRKTIIRRLWSFLVYQNINCYKINKVNKKEITKDEKNFRYILNKYYYTKQKRTLTNCYLYLLREKYCDNNGQILKKHPTINQFRYYFNKTKKLDSLYISRQTRSDYDSNYRPLLGKTNNVFNSVGFSMVDSSTLDLYVLDSDNVPRRPILSVCVDSYSQLCLGFYLSFNGDTQHLCNLMKNVCSNKKEYCESLGIDISLNDWPSQGLPHSIITDNGSNYVSNCFTSLTLLGIEIKTNKTHCPQDKPQVEVFFRLLNEIFKPYLFYKGGVDKNNPVNNPKKEAILNLKDTEILITKCIVFYNSKRIINLPYNKQYLKPYSSALFSDSIQENPNNFIDVEKETIDILFLPRTTGTFTRFGLKVGKLYYKAFDFVNDFLNGSKNEEVIYNPDDCSKVYLIRDKIYEFLVVDKYFKDMSLEEATKLITKSNEIKNQYIDESLNSKIQLGREIEKMIEEKENC